MLNSRHFMDHYAPAMGYEISYDQYHEFKLDIGKVLQDNEHITPDNFLDVEEPDLVDDDPETPLSDLQGQGRADPEYKNTIESLNVEDKHIILESDDDKLVECTLKWVSMCNKNVQKKIKESFVKEEAKQEEEEEEEIVVEEGKTRIHRSHMSHLEALMRKRNQFHLNAPQRRRNRGKRKQTFRDDETAPEEKHAQRFYYGQDITGNEDDSVFES